MIDIVTHVYAKVLSHYATLLRFQLRSLVNNPAVGLVLICHTPDDELVNLVLREFVDQLPLKSVPLSVEHLGRRHFGRDVASGLTIGDLVWFADCDYVFGEGCLQDAHTRWKERQEWPPVPTCYYPSVVRISATHELGDKLITQANMTKPIPAIPEADFVDARQRRPIGGTFIVDGAYVRRRGYLHGGKWAPPWPESIPPFASTRCDVCFRGQCARDGKIEKMNVSNLFRIRHGQTTVCNEQYRLTSQMSID